jgi:glycosyltransferase involved in cell wall biosynthesis
MNSEPTFAIVIPTFNAEGHIGTLLASIEAQSCSNYEIVVVDQGSSDRTVEIASSRGCAVVSIPPPLFYTPPGRSRNLGAASIAGHILLHLDADMELGSIDLLERLEALIDSNHRAGIIHESDVASGFWSNCKALERSCYRGTLLEAARVVTRELFTEVGGYDEEISSGEDFFITRLYERETQVVTSDALWLRHHAEGSSLGSLLRKKFAYGRTAKVYLRKARRVGAPSEASIVRASLRAYSTNWRLLFSRPMQYLCVFPLRAMEFIAVRVGMWVDSRAHVRPPRRSAPS